MLYGVSHDIRDSLGQPICIPRSAHVAITGVHELRRGTNGQFVGDVSADGLEVARLQPQLIARLGARVGDELADDLRHTLASLDDARGHTRVLLAQRTARHYQLRGPNHRVERVAQIVPDDANELLTKLGGGFERGFTCTQITGLVFGLALGAESLVQLVLRSKRVKHELLVCLALQ